MLIIGKIVKAQGIKGEVKIIPITDDVLRFNKLKKATERTRSRKHRCRNREKMAQQRRATH